VREKKIFPEDELTPRERVRLAVNLREADRCPIAPQLGFHAAHAGGISVREFMTDGSKAARACRRAWLRYGGFDMPVIYFPAAYAFPFLPDAHSRFWNEWHIPEDDELPMLLEKELLHNYDTLFTEGIITLARTEKGKLLREVGRMAMEALRFLWEFLRTMPRLDYYGTYAGSLVNHPADLLAMWRGFDNFMLDLATEPQKVKEACEFMVDGLVEIGETLARITGSRQVLVGVSRISGSFISPRMFEEIFFETFLRIVNRLNRDGFSITFHLDNDYTPMLDYFLEFPRKCGIMHLDQTDMFRAKEILGDHICLMGNLHPGLLANGTPQEVEAACERLIKEVGAGGGFILANACEVPINAPFENILAMKQAVRKWGWY